MWRRRLERPPATYGDVRLVAEVLSRINVGLIERHFGLNAETARQFMARLVTERRFGDLQPDGWHYPPVRKLRVRRSRGKPKVADESKVEVGTSPEDSAQRIGELEREGFTLRAQIKRLQAAGKTVIAQREEWKARALAGEEFLESERDRHATSQGRFDALRRLIAKELHPDACDGGQLEKLIRDEFFKRVWSRIEEIAEGRAE
jgi:hypothetical protein